MDTNSHRHRRILASRIRTSRDVVAWNSGHQTDMARKNVLAVTLLVLVAGAVFLIRRVGFRCEALPVASKQLRAANLCYSWFRLHLLTFADQRERVFYYGIIMSDYSIGSLPREEYVD